LSWACEGSAHGQSRENALGEKREKAAFSSPKNGIFDVKTAFFG